MMVSGAGKAFDAQGKLVDVATRAQLEKYMAAFAHFVSRHAADESKSPS